MEQLLIPLLTALVGLLGGLGVARLQARSREKTDQEKIVSEKEAALSRLALEIAKLEFERATVQGRETESSILAHWAVLRVLMKEHESGSDFKTLPPMVRYLNNRYGGLCWEDNKQHFTNEEEFLKAYPSLLTERSLEVIKEFFEFLPTDVEWTVTRTEGGSPRGRQVKGGI